jgi:DNA-binding NtrC family response regulator
MDGFELTTSAKRPRDGRDKRRVRGLGLRVLVVEDDEQVLTVLSTLLESEGYEVAVATTADAGLRALRNNPFHLVVSDYWLPDRTGAWMLSEASHQGLLQKSQVLVITAEHRPQGVENLIVLRKPLDLDDFLRHVNDILAPVRQEELERVKQEVEESVRRHDGVDAARVQLTLYISTSSPSSLKALRNLQRLLSEYDARSVRLTVCDLSRDTSGCAEEDRIAFTPTLVKRTPDPKVWILGDLENPEIISDLLAHSGVERSR